MNKINFKNGETGRTPLNATNLNLLQDNVEEGILSTQEDIENKILTTEKTTDIAEELTITDCAGVNGSLDIKDGKTIQDGEPTPDTPIEIRNVGDNIQLFDKDGEVTNIYINADGEETTDTKFKYIKQTLIPQSSEYIMRYKEIYDNAYVRFTYYNGDTFISREVNNGNNYIFTVPDNCTKIDIRTDTEVNYFTDLKIEQGSKATSYSEYGCGSVGFKLENEDSTQSKTITFPLTEGQLLHQGDYLAEDGIHQVKGTKILDGTENWNKSSYSDDTYFCGFLTPSFTVMKEKTGNVNTHFKIGIYSEVTNEECMSNRNQFHIRILASRLTENSVVGLQTYLAEQYANGTPVTVEYELAEETITPYTPEQEQAYYELQHLLMYEGYTSIECIDEIKPDIQVTYLYNNELNNYYGERFDKVETDISDCKLNGDFAVLSGEVTIPAQTGAIGATLSYPDGFTSENCVLISFGSYYNENKGYAYGYHSNDSVGSLFGTNDRDVILTEENILVWYKNISDIDVTLNYKILLMKYTK